MHSLSGILSNHSSGTFTDVAIKVPKGPSNEKMAEFYVEAEAAIEFNQQSILKCLGISW